MDDIASVTVCVPGQPVPWARPRRGANGSWFTAVRQQQWSDMASVYVKAAWRGIAPFEGPLCCDLTFHFERPVRRPDNVADRHRRDWLEGLPVPMAGRGDLDNLCKIYLDALQFAAFADDAQVVRIQAVKMYAARNDPPGAWATVYCWA